MRLRLVCSFLLSLVSLLALSGCQKPKPGGECKQEAEVKCVDKKNALLCMGGKWEQAACRGIVGCIPGACNNQGYEANDPCLNEGDFECSVDKKAMLKCSAHRWTKQDDCRGQLGCVANAQGVKCDKGTSESGDTCTVANEGNASCSPDKKHMLVCKGGKMTQSSHCRGMHGCRQKGTQIDCDDSIAELGDPCDDHSGPACQADKKAVLKCKSGKMAVDKKCKQCTVFLDKIQCR